MACTVAVTPSVHAADPAPNDPKTAARALADQGADAYAQGDFARAHELFVRAYALVPAPTVALFEARSLVQMGRFVDAREAYVRASSAPLPDDAPAPFRQAVTDATVELAALDRRTEAVPPIAAEPREREPGAPLSGGADRTRSPLRTLGFVSFGVGAAGLALGISTGLVAVGAHRDAERRCPDRLCVRGSAGAESLERFERYRTISTVGYAIGAAGAVAGTILILRSPEDAEPRLAVTASVGRVTLEGAF